MNRIHFAFICFLLDSDDWPSMWIMLRIAILCVCVHPPIYFLKDLENICRLKKVPSTFHWMLVLGELVKTSKKSSAAYGGLWTQIHGKHEDKTWNIKLFLVWPTKVRFKHLLSFIQKWFMVYMYGKISWALKKY